MKNLQRNGEKEREKGGGCKTATETRDTWPGRAVICKKSFSVISRETS